MSIDDWKRIVDIFTLGSALVAFVLLVASWKIGNIISARDDTAKKQLEAAVLDAKTGLAKQEERAAIAERATEEIRRENIGRDERLATALKDAREPLNKSRRDAVENVVVADTASTLIGGDGEWRNSRRSRAWRGRTRGRGRGERRFWRRWTASFRGDSFSI